MPTLPTGTVVGNYTIVSVLGVGGMGEVYKAHDPALGRHIALKVLTQKLVQHEDLVIRFIQEARAASALNHPNIVTIHDIGSTIIEAPEGSRYTHFIAMELVEGETLRAKSRDPEFTLSDRLDILAQAADGLAKAHLSGIVHRDLKPENVMVTPEGFAKVLDFGLAKLQDRRSQLDASPDETTDKLEDTKPGMLMGTFSYMSPEQVERRPADHRADIFSFGSIIYHVVCGRSPFASDSMIDTLHAIVHSEPDPLVEVAPDAPGELDTIVRRCLAKNPEERYQSMKELAADLREVRRMFETVPPGTTRISRPLVDRAGRGPMTVAAIAIAVAVISIVAALVLLRKEVPAPAPAPFEAMSIKRISGTSRSIAMALSPDGKYLVHAVDEGQGHSLWVRQIETGSDIPLVPLDDVHYVDSIVSPDGNYVYYVSAHNDTDVGAVHRVPLLGGAANQTIVEDLHSRIAISRDGSRLAWSTQDREAGETRLVVGGADGAGQRVVSARPLPDAWGAVSWAPDGTRVVAALRAYEEGFGTSLVEVSVETGAVRHIGADWRTIERLVWAGDGSTIVVNGKETPTSTRNQLWLVDARDGSRHRITNDLNDYEGLSPSLDGHSLVTLQKTQASALWLVPDGDASKARPLVRGSENIDGASGLTWTADGAVVYASEGSDERDLWRVALDGSPPQRLTDGHSDVLPSATADGRYVVFVSTRAGQPNVWRVNSDGGAPLRLTSGSHETSPDATPDSRSVVYHSDRAGARTVWRVSIDGGAPVQITSEPSSWPSVSPDGSHIACSWWDASQTRARIAVVPIDGPTPETLLDIPVNFWLGANNHHTRWSRDGKSLLYVDKHDGVANVWSRPVDGGEPKRLTGFVEGAEIFWFDLSKDGRDLALARGSITSHVVLIRDFK